jgi:hypothetical protein
LYKTQYKGGRKRQVFNKTTHKIAIFKEELLDVQCLSFKVVNFDLASNLSHSNNCKKLNCVLHIFTQVKPLLYLQFSIHNTKLLEISKVKATAVVSTLSLFTNFGLWSVVKLIQS